MANTSDFVLPCAMTHTDNNTSKIIFVPYVPEDVEITHVIPIYRSLSEPNSFCKWRIYLNDRQNRGPCMQLHNTFYQFFNLYKPRNTLSAHIQFHGLAHSASLWSVEYTLFWCICGSQSDFIKTKFDSGDQDDINKNIGTFNLSMKIKEMDVKGKQPNC